MVHRIDFEEKGTDNPDPVPNELLDGPALLKRITPILKTGRAYHALIRADENGTVEQLIPLSRRGAHAYQHNYEAIGVAVVGDFRKSPMPPEQHASLMWVCAGLGLLNSEIEIVRHDGVPGASADPDKVCPGHFIDVEATNGFVRALRSALQLDAKKSLEEQGWTL